jgi:hypothetical protein
VSHRKLFTLILLFAFLFEVMEPSSAFVREVGSHTLQNSTPWTLKKADTTQPDNRSALSADSSQSEIGPDQPNDLDQNANVPGSQPSMHSIAAHGITPLLNYLPLFSTFSQLDKQTRPSAELKSIYHPPST